MACRAEQTEDEFTLYVTNLPGELNEEGLLEIFTDYGVVTSHYIRRRWAYITYGSYAEAESAIRDLNDRPPLRLKVSFGKQENEEGFNKTSITAPNDEQETTSIKTPNKSMSASLLTTPTTERTKPLDVVNKPESNPGIMKHVTESGRLPNDLCKNADPYESSNALWIRGQFTVTPDAKRHISFGRGYTMYQVPEPMPQIDNHISDVYEKRTFGVYEYGKDELQNKVGNCQLCSRITKFYCERCYVFYCSKNCQVTDWPRHKKECETLPALVTSAHSMPVEFEQSKQEQSPVKRISSNYTSPRQLKKLSDTQKNSNESPGENHGLKDVGVKPDMAFVANNLRAKLAKEQSVRAQTEIEKTTMPEQKHAKTQLDKDTVSENVSPTQLNNCENKWKKVEEDISFSKDEFLSASKFTDVRIIVSTNRECWVQNVEKDRDLENFMINLQAKVAEGRKMKPVTDRIYAVKYENVWHRAVIKSFDPLIVHYIDYGNDDTVDSDDFREIYELKHVQKFAAKIRLTEKAYEMLKDLKYDDIISVKTVSIDSDKTINVEVMGEKDLLTSNDKKTDSDKSVNVEVRREKDLYTSNDKKTGNGICNIPIPPKLENRTNDIKTSETSASVIGTSNMVDKLKSVVNAVAIGETGVFEIHSKIKSNTYAITFLPNNAFMDYALLLNDLPQKCAEVAQNGNHKPTVGELICGLKSGTENEWLRGYLLSSSNMAVLDDPGEVSIDKTVACPNEYLNINTFGASCEVIDAKYEFKENNQYKFEVTARVEQDKIEIKIFDEGNTINANIKPWTPNSINAEKKDLKKNTFEFANLKSGDKVVISNYRSPVFYFVHSLNSEELEYFSSIMRRVGICAQKSQTLKELPAIGQLVIAQFIDKNFYRAMVLKVEEEKVTISYVDFGNTEVTHIEKLKVISDDLKQLRSCSAKIKLKDVPNDVPLTKEATKYLEFLVANETALLCKFDGIPSKDGVYLEEPNGKSVNKTITELLMPTSEKTSNEKVCYMASDLSVVSLGNVGDTIKVVILYTINECYQYAMCPFDSDLMVYIYNVMPKMIAKYCEENEYYIPRDNELCLAAYLNGWYRAVCKVRNYTATSSTVFFIDFGNTEIVSHEDIRLMPNDFIAHDAMANICNLVNVAPTINGQYPPQIEEKIKKYIVPDSTIKVKIVRFDDESGQFDVELLSV